MLLRHNLLHTCLLALLLHPSATLHATQKASTKEASTQDEKDLLDAMQAEEYNKAQNYINKVTNVNIHDKHLCTPLHWAAYSGQELLVEKLIKKGAKVDVQDEDKGTPLHWAAAERHEKVVNTLIKANASVNLQDNEKKTPLHTTLEKEDDDDKQESVIKEKRKKLPSHSSTLMPTSTSQIPRKEPLSTSPLQKGL